MYRCCAAIPPLSFLLFSLVSRFASLFHRPPSNLFASRLVPSPTFCPFALGKFCQKHVAIKNSRVGGKNGKNVFAYIERRLKDRLVDSKRSIPTSDSRKKHFFRVRLLFKEITAKRDGEHAGYAEAALLRSPLFSRFSSFRTEKDGKKE